jgi:hypothetical protein
MSQPPGPYETEADTRPVTRPVYEAFRVDPGVGKMAPHNLKLLTDAVAVAGVELGDYDNRILRWLAGWEPATCAVIAGLITRAHAAGRQRSGPSGPVPLAQGLAAGPEAPVRPQPALAASLTRDQLRTVLSALDVAADYKRDAADVCGECSEYDVCTTCQYRLTVADEYEALAEQLKEATR